MIHTMTPEHADARPRADSSAVSKAPRRGSPKKRCHTCMKHESERVQESSTRPRQSPPTARYKIKSTKTAAFSRKTVHSIKQVKRTEKTGIRIQQKDEISLNSKAWELQPVCNARERSVKNKTRRRT